jgi:hypothetical protein
MSDRIPPYVVYKDDSHELSILPRGSYIQEYDGFYNWAVRTGVFMLCTGGETTPRGAYELEFPVTVQFVPGVK